jgi:sec-independent protein translocase protein TatA
VFGLGGGELGILLLIVVLLFFGPSQLPKMARGVGEALREFKKAQREISDEITREEPPAVSKGAEAKPPENKPIS